jgi:DNA-binding SARP family transcriptional activator
VSSASEGRLRLLLLGPVDLRHDDVSLAIGGEKARSVLAMLGLAGGRVVSVDSLIDGIWGEQPPASAINALQYHVSVLRKGLTAAGAGDAMRTLPPGYALDVVSDLAEFTAEVAGAQQLAIAARQSATGEPGDAASAQVSAQLSTQASAGYTAALERWRGPALADLTGVPFAAPKALVLDSARLAALEALVDLQLEAGHAAAWIPRLEELVSENPTRESLWGQLMTALYRAGQQAAALAAYGRARQLLDDELGVDPSPALQRLHARILSQDPSLTPPSVPVAAPQARPSSGSPPGRAVVAGVSVVATRMRTRARAGAGFLVLPDGERVRLKPRTTVIGRHPECDVVLDDPDVSRRHAEIAAGLEPGHLLRDLGSTNGTALNGHDVVQPTALQPGDRIELGAVVLRYETDPGYETDPA